MDAEGRGRGPAGEAPRAQGARAGSRIVKGLLALVLMAGAGGWAAGRIREVRRSTRLEAAEERLGAIQAHLEAGRLSAAVEAIAALEALEIPRDPGTEEDLRTPLLVRDLRRTRALWKQLASAPRRGWEPSDPEAREAFRVAALATAWARWGGYPGAGEPDAIWRPLGVARRLAPDAVGPRALAVLNRITGRAPAVDEEAMPWGDDARVAYFREKAVAEAAPLRDDPAWAGLTRWAAEARSLYRARVALGAAMDRVATVAHKVRDLEALPGPDAPREDHLRGQIAFALKGLDRYRSRIHAVVARPEPILLIGLHPSESDPPRPSEVGGIPEWVLRPPEDLESLEAALPGTFLELHEEEGARTRLGDWRAFASGSSAELVDALFSQALRDGQLDRARFMLAPPRDARDPEARAEVAARLDEARGMLGLADPLRSSAGEPPGRERSP